MREWWRGIRWIFYRNILTALTDLQIFESVSIVLLKSGKTAAVEKSRGKYHTSNAYTAENHGHKRWARHYSVGKFNVNLCFAP